METTDAAEILAAFTAGFDGAKAPAATRAAAMLDLIDTLGCAAAGINAGGVRELRTLMRNWGGKPEATLWFGNAAVPGPGAALVNGTQSHAVEYDDTHDRGAFHAGVTVIPAVFAAAERRGSLSGNDVLAAIITGVEVASRLALATKRGPGVTGWLLTPLCGTFGAAAGAARALGLNGEQTLHALGIAYSQAAGNGQGTIDGALSKRMQAGLAARSGLLAAVLAASGLTGARQVFEGVRGYFKVYHGNEYDRSALVDRLGASFEVEELSYKPYPCCRWTHAALEAALDLKQRGIAPGEISAVDVAVSRQAYMSTGQPLGEKQVPRNIVTAQFSIPYSVAVAFHSGGVSLGDFTATAISRRNIIDFAKKVSVRAVDQWPGEGDRGVSPARITVTMADGATATSEIAVPSGNGRDPGTTDVIRRKFVDCCVFGGLARAAGADLLQAIDGLPHAADAVPIIRRMAAGPLENPDG